jgi:hypothetical protein
MIQTNSLRKRVKYVPFLKETEGDNMNDDTKFIVMFLLCIGVAVLIGYFIWDTNDRFDREKYHVISSALIPLNINIMDGKIDSPALIIEVNTLPEFIRICETNKATTVYKSLTNRYPYIIHYFVFNEEMTIAYEYMEKDIRTLIK